MISYLIQITVKILFTGILLLFITLCGIEIWRLWFDRTLVLVPFGYIRDGEPVREAGQHFSLLVSQDLNQLRDLYSQTQSGDISIPSTDQIGRGENLELPVLRESLLSNIEVQAYGIQLSTLIKSMTRWIERPNEIVGNVSERNKVIDVYAELRTSSPIFESDHPGRWYLFQMSDVHEASHALACRVFRMLAAGHSKFYLQSTDADFYVFSRALQKYQLYRVRLVEVTGEEEANKALTQASHLVNELLNRHSKFPFAYKLAAYVFREEGRLSNAEKAISHYLALLEDHGQSDKEAVNLLALLQGEPSISAARVEKSPEALNLRFRTRPVQPGTSVSSAKYSSAGTICCFVQDSEGQQYVLSADHVFHGDMGTPIFQPGIFDGGQPADQIAVLYRRIALQPNQANREAGAIAIRMPDVEISSEVPGIGPIQGIASALQPGDAIMAVGRTSGLVEGTVTATDMSARIHTPEPVLFEGLIQTTSISGPGDSGAPVLTKDGKLVGMIYAGSPTMTLVMPIEPVLRALDVKLVQ